MAKSSPFRVAILGAGGIGCYYGARLQQAACSVTYVARGQHLQALQTTGLRLQHPDFMFSEPVLAISLEHLFADHQPEQFDLLVICIKANATESVAIRMQQWFEQHQQTTPILSLQNGVDNEPVIARFVGEQHLLGGLAIRIGAHIVEPGHVEATGVAQVRLGSWPNHTGQFSHHYPGQLDKITDVFNQAHIPTEQVIDIQRELWRKLLINNGVNPLSALTGLDTQVLTHHNDFTHIIRGLMQEVAIAAKADDVVLEQQDVDELFHVISHFDAIKTSMLVDLEKGRPLEIDAICGAVLSRCQALGQAAPYTETIRALLLQKIS